MLEVGSLNVVIHLISCLILEHLGQKLRGWNVCIEFFILVLDGTALVLEYHRSTSFAVLQLYIIAYKSLAVDKRHFDVIRLIYIHRVRNGRWVCVRILAISRTLFLRGCSFRVCISRIWLISKLLYCTSSRVFRDARPRTNFACFFALVSIKDLTGLLPHFIFL